MDHEMFNLQKIDSIKKTMLFHEDIFQRQVKELHRLYDRQIKLMDDLKKETKYNECSLAGKDAKSSQFSIWQQQMEDIGSNLPVYSLTYDQGERSASCSGESLKMSKGINLERVAEEGPSTSIQPSEHDQQRPNSYRHSRSNNRNMDGSDEEIDVELTLSIGCSNSNKRSNSQMKPCSLELVSSDSHYNGKELCSSTVIERDTREDFGDPSPALSSSSATLNQNTNAPRSHWLFQDLSLNRT
ncbi:hypothetical protein ACH5RR_003850 [Cinchona calisaya]|uniref:Uncharacterized protein n=1 Tax=Cinchona calisaya TaxID=153742 RepID=A0ABD3AW10_9GENT